MNPYLDDGDLVLYHGDVIDTLRQLPAGIAQTCVTSPPYWGLRDYGTGQWTGGDAECDHAQGRNTNRTPEGTKQATNNAGAIDLWPVCGRCGARRVDSQLGLENSPAEYVERMVAVFREVWRVLRDDGTVWLNLGDSYMAAAGPNSQTANKGGLHYRLDGTDIPASSARMTALRSHGLKPKDLVGIPWRVALALQADGWYLRSDIIWNKPNPMPESVSDRPTKAHEYLFLLSKQPRYFYDADAIREEAEYGRSTGGFRGEGAYVNGRSFDNSSRVKGNTQGHTHEGGRNRRSVWTIATQPQPEAHFATFPEALVRPCILAGTSERGECSVCGAPWQREVERETVRELAGDAVQDRGRAAAGLGNKLSVSHSPGNPNGAPQSPRITTLGWRASCECQSGYETVTDNRHLEAHYGPMETRPQIVLDPFIGSGTTALVARKHGRRCIGIDLSAEYLDIAARRLQQLSLFAEPS